MNRERWSSFRILMKDGGWLQWALLLIALIAALGIRYAVRANFTPDYSIHMANWIVQLREQGPAALSQDFSTYSGPFMTLFGLAAALPVKGLYAVKALGLFFDFVLAVGAAAIVFHFRRRAVIAGTAGVATLLLPEVFLNSGMWGQVDSVFTALLVWTAYALVTRRYVLAWGLFAAALMIKLQAIFFLPWMALAFLVQRHRIRVLAVPIAVAVVACLPSLIAGRSVGSLLSDYMDQVGGDLSLSEGAASIYQWVPDTLFETVRPAAICLTVGVLALLCATYLRRSRQSLTPELWLLRVAPALGFVVPLLLPQMHDRYFYPAGVFLFVCAVLSSRYVLPALASQFVAVMAYSPFLFGQEPIVPLGILSVVQLAITAWLVWLSLLPDGQFSANYLGGSFLQPAATLAADAPHRLPDEPTSDRKSE